MDRAFVVGFWTGDVFGMSVVIERVGGYVGKLLI
jgi:hypothetical protein